MERTSRRQQANRNGFHVINRENGEFIRATSYMEQLNWVDSMEPSGDHSKPEALPSGSDDANLSGALAE